eukprot:6606020-Prymnesium_polylepis.1
MKFPAAPFPDGPVPADDAALSILSGSSLVRLILHLVVSCDLTTPPVRTTESAYPVVLGRDLS